MRAVAALSFAQSGSDQMPAWVVSIAESLAGRTHVYKALKVMETEHTKQMRKAQDEATQQQLKTDSLEAELEAARQEIAKLKDVQATQATAAKR